jgi:hypothetical protein
MKKVEVLSLVNSSISSIFSKEDVINLINGIDEVKGRVITPQQMSDAIDEVISYIEQNSDSIVNKDTAEFELNYDNRIELVNIDFDSDYIRESLEETFAKFVGEEEDVIELEREEPAGAVSI